MSDEEWIDLMSWIVITALCVIVAKAIMGM